MNPSRPARRAGHIIAALIPVVLLVVVNGWPGWSAAPFLTADAGRLIGLLNLSLALSAVANVAYAIRDPAWLVALGGLITTGVGLYVLMAVWRVFPFDFGASPGAWPVAVRSVLVLGIVGSLIGLVVQFVALIRALLTRPAGRG